MSSLYKLLALSFIILVSATGSLKAKESNTTADWREMPKYYQLGYIAALGDMLIHYDLGGKNGKKVRDGYRKCLGGQRPSTILEVVNNYITKTPSSLTYSPDNTVFVAMREMCEPYLPKHVKR